MPRDADGSGSSASSRSVADVEPAAKRAPPGSPTDEIEDALIDDESLSDEDLVRNYANVIGNDTSQVDSTPDQQCVAPSLTQWIWSAQGIRFESVTTYTESKFMVKIEGGFALDWSWDKSTPLPCAELLDFRAPCYLEMWKESHLQCINYPLDERVRSANRKTVPVVLHMPTRTAWMTLDDAAKILGRPWITMGSNLPAALVTSRLCVSPQPFFRIGGPQAAAVLNCIKNFRSDLDEDPPRGLPSADSGEMTVFGIPAFVCTSTSFENLKRTLTQRMLPPAIRS